MFKARFELGEHLWEDSHVLLGHPKVSPHLRNLLWLHVCKRRRLTVCRKLPNICISRPIQFEIWIRFNIKCDQLNIVLDTWEYRGFERISWYTFVLKILRDSTLNSPTHPHLKTVPRFTWGLLSTEQYVTDTLSVCHKCEGIEFGKSDILMEPTHVFWALHTKTDSPRDVLCTNQCATNLCGVSAGAAQLYTSLPLSRAEFLYILT